MYILFLTLAHAISLSSLSSSISPLSLSLSLYLSSLSLSLPLCLYSFSNSFPSYLKGAAMILEFIVIYSLLVVHVEQLTMKANRVILSELAMLDLSPANCAKSAQLWEFGEWKCLCNLLSQSCFLFVEACTRVITKVCGPKAICI